VDNTQIYFSNIEKLVKYYQVENGQDMLDRTQAIKQYLDSLNIDKRKIAAGFDMLIWYFDMFGTPESHWNINYSSTYGGGVYEEAFLMSKPTKSLMTFPAWNTGLARIINEKSEVTFVNGYQLDIFEQFCKKETETWSYDTVLREELEKGTAGPFDFIAMNTFDIHHEPSLSATYFNMLSPGGVMVIGHVNDNGDLYSVAGQYNPNFEMITSLKNLENCILHHDHTALGTAIAIKL
jgi:hypothetical protein